MHASTAPADPRRAALPPLPPCVTGVRTMVDRPTTSVGTARLCGRGFSVSLGRRTRAGGLGWPLSRSQHEATAEEIEARPAKHLTFEHLEAIDMPLHGAARPGQGHAGFDGGIVVAEPTRKASYGLQHTRARPLQPWIQVLGLALADQAGEVLREVDRL